ncbi:MAG: hypothetical protein ACOYLN_13970, partial [Blastocatellia bacterium]
RTPEWAERLNGPHAYIQNCFKMELCVKKVIPRLCFDWESVYNPGIESRLTGLDLWSCFDPTSM